MPTENNTSINEELAERLGLLLAQSPLDEKVKDFLAENVEKLPEDLIYRLIESLEGEQEQLHFIEEELRGFMVDFDKKWDEELPLAQEKLAQEIADQEFDSLIQA